MSTQAALGPGTIARGSWRVWGTTASVAVAPAELLAPATRIVKDEIAALDAACNRFRPGSEISRINRSGGWPVRVSGVLLEALEAADTAYRRTRGAVDPTVGLAGVAPGYDRDFDAVAAGFGGPGSWGPPPDGGTPSCAEANAYSTASIVWGGYGPFEVAQAGLAARFVAADDEVLTVGGWPAGDAPPSA